MVPRSLALLAACSCFIGANALHAAETFPRPIPPPGIPVPDDVRAELTKGAIALAKRIEELGKSTNSAGVLRELPNIEVFHKAVYWALRYNEFFDAKQFAIAREQLQQGHARLAAIQNTNRDNLRNPPWNSATGLVVRGYRSEIDGSVQPYGLVIPAEWKPDDGKAWPLHFWCHGRGEKLTELAFIDDRQRNRGEFGPPGVIVCHLYGRYCNANKFAGERDLFEALDDIKKYYRIDEQRLVIRGFSMGGAAAWQFATHHAGIWAAAAPGAGFAETAEFFKVFAAGKTPPPWWEQTLWRWYDATLYARNLVNTKTIAYSGEIDGQKQAADIMIRFAKEEGVEFPHIIGPQTAHKYHPESKPKIEEFITAAAEKGADEAPKNLRFVTFSLIYPETKWLRIDSLEKHWERAELDWAIDLDGALQIKTRNVARFSFRWPHGKRQTDFVFIDGQQQPVAPLDASTYSGLKKDGRWGTSEEFDLTQPGKRPGVCGPIDHAFMAPFLFVRPTGKPINDAVGAWADAEFKHATEFWRKVFRGDAPVKDDTALTADDIKNKHLILWGDFSSNAVLRSMATLGVRNGGHSRDPLGLPYQWSAETLQFRGKKYEAAHHMPVFIFPNPLNPQKYIVLNSGPTFREEALLNNSDQTPKLPDWAVIDLRTPPGPKWPGLVVDAGFFNEEWK